MLALNFMVSAFYALCGIACAAMAALILYGTGRIIYRSIRGTSRKADLKPKGDRNG